MYEIICKSETESAPLLLVMRAFFKLINTMMTGWSNLLSKNDNK